MEALRALKRRLFNIVYKTTLDDAITHAAASSRTSPGGQRETTLTPARPASSPHRLFGQATSPTRHDQA